MSRSFIPETLSVNWKRPLVSLMIVWLLLVPFGPFGATREDAPRAQPELLRLAVAQPQDSIGIIVQRAGEGHAAEELVARLGGTVVRDLSIINGFEAEVPAWTIEQLARSTAIRWLSLNATMIENQQSRHCRDCIGLSNLQSLYPRVVRAHELWNDSPYLQGQGVTVAVIDSGIAEHDDLRGRGRKNSRVIANVKQHSDSATPVDYYGHGTHIAGIIGGNGYSSNGEYIGIAPRVNLINVKVSNDIGSATMSDLVAGLQWVLDHKDDYNIRVVNISMNSSVMESYHTSPLSAAVEILWFNDIVVVVSAGNRGTAALYPPANDPFVITVGATDDGGTVELSDDVMAPFSAYGTTGDGFAKPDLVAPGTDIISLLSRDTAKLATDYPAHVHRPTCGQSGCHYFRMSGTSVAAPIVAGAVALLLQDEPTLTADQVKFRLMVTARPFATRERAGAGLLDIFAAVHGTTTESANTGIRASQLLWTGSEVTAWNSVNWNSVNWNSVNWNSVNWNSVNWNSDFWGEP